MRGKMSTSPKLAMLLEALFWRQLTLAAMQTSDLERERWIDTATHVMYHAIFTDARTRPFRSARSRRRWQSAAHP
jgi:hypothetical protein